MFSKLLVFMMLDDVVDAIPVHLGGGLIGMLGVGLFASPKRLKSYFGHREHIGFLYSLFGPLETIDGNLLGAQIVAVGFIVAWTAVIMFPFFVFLDWKGMFRIDEVVEAHGMDMSFHGGVQQEVEVDKGLTEQAEEFVMSLTEEKLRKSTLKRRRRNEGVLYEDEEKVPS